MKFELMDLDPQNAVIKVVGVGGGGNNAVNHMLHANIEGVDFICANTDAQALKSSDVRTVLQLGSAVTKGLGAGADPNVGRSAAIEDKERIAESIEGADMVFITAGMGGGTGTGAAPVVAEVAREKGILTVAVVTRPFPFEGPKRARIAEEGIRELSHHVDSLITIPNEKLLQELGRDMSLLNAFKAANDVLLGAVQGIAELITRPGLVNVDFADVRTVMSTMGRAMMGSGIAKGQNRAEEAAQQAISSPLLEDINLAGAKGILVNITAGLDMTIGEFDEVGNTVRAFAHDDADIVMGTAIDPEMEEEMRVTVVATGLGESSKEFKENKEAKEEVVEQEESKPRIRPVRMEKDPEPAPAPVAQAPEPAPVEEPKPQKPVQVVERKPRRQDLDAAADGDMEYLDIPAFLRRQAD